jgi:hypothetical protein
MRILICGDRNWAATKRYDFGDSEEEIDKANFEADLLVTILRGFVNNFDEVEIISGMAKGADSLAAEFAWSADIPLHQFPAQWDLYKKSAGPIRNQQMLDIGKPDLVIGFHNNILESKGTRHMLDIAKKAGVKTYLVSEW